MEKNLDRLQVMLLMHDDPTILVPFSQIIFKTKIERNEYLHIIKRNCSVNFIKNSWKSLAARHKHLSILYLWLEAALCENMLKDKHRQFISRKIKKGFKWVCKYLLNKAYKSEHSNHSSVFCFLLPLILAYIMWYISLKIVFKNIFLFSVKDSQFEWLLRTCIIF